jgi:pimeloyl-ACP methyl ester carboxylesterase
VIQACDVDPSNAWPDGRNSPINSGEIYQRAIPRARLVVIENCGHMPEMEKPTEFAGLIENFLAR